MTKASDISDRLATHALSVCRQFLSNGRRQGSYWIVGDIRNTPGRSMYVRLVNNEAGHCAGRWTDAATGEYGDLLDIIQESLPSRSFTEALIAAENFVGSHARLRPARFRADRPRRSNTASQAKRLFCQCTSIKGTLGEAYLLGRSIDPAVAPGLRYHPTCYCKPQSVGGLNTRPALIAPVTDVNGELTGVHRIYLDPAGPMGSNLGKAPLDVPKRSLGRIQNHAVRFGAPASLIVVAEGIENALSVRTAFPDLTVHAALSAGNLAAYAPPADTTRLLIALDDDDPGRWAAQALTERRRSRHLSISLLRSRTNDHNRDLRTFGLEAYRAALLCQLAA